MDPPSTIITHPETGQDHTFTYDYSYDSSDSKAEGYASQETVWNDLGIVVLDNAWAGYNVTLFAYGQTGSGKSYSMTSGNSDDKEKNLPKRLRGDSCDRKKKSEHADVMQMQRTGGAGRMKLLLTAVEPINAVTTTVHGRATS